MRKGILIFSFLFALASHAAPKGGGNGDFGLIAILDDARFELTIRLEEQHFAEEWDEKSLELFVNLITVLRSLEIEALDWGTEEPYELYDQEKGPWVLVLNPVAWDRADLNSETKIMRFALKIGLEVLGEELSSDYLARVYGALRL